MKHLHRSLLLTAALLAGAGTTASGSTAPADGLTGRPPTSDKIDQMLKAMGEASTWGHPDLFGEFAGMRHFYAGEYDQAMKYFKYGARYADKLSQFTIGLMYYNGRGVKQNLSSACAWLKLAAQRDYPHFVEVRDTVCSELTAHGHDQAAAKYAKLLPTYGDKVAKGRMALALRLAKNQRTGSHIGYNFGAITSAVKSNCTTATINILGINMPKAGCGGAALWSPWRWDPGTYFKVRDAQWAGTVTVGALQEADSATSGTLLKSHPGDSRPAPASSAGH